MKTPIRSLFLIMKKEREQNKERDQQTKVVIFTDLDGTLLDHETYSFAPAAEALATVKETKTPLIFITSKTFSEIELIQKDMGIWRKQPFIVENGGAVYIPEDYFPFPVQKEVGDRLVRRHDGFDEIVLGVPYERVRNALLETAEKMGIPIRTVGDMDSAGFAKETGLTHEQAARAKSRSYQEGFSIMLSENEQETARNRLQAAIEEKGYAFSVGGRFNQIAGKKGTKVHALHLLSDLYIKQFSHVTTIGLGDAQSDVAFLAHCDRGFFIANPKKIHHVAADNIEMISETGPKGWNTAVLSVLAQ
jgi:mannosyl-3-phosphoglycerate phosphatase